MTTVAWVDTNALIALLEGSGHAHHQAALAIFRRVADRTLDVIVTAVVFVELTWYLQHRLGWTRSQSGVRLQTLLAADGVRVADQGLARAVDLYAADRRLDFADAYLAALATTTGPPSVVSFDRDLDRVEGVIRLAS